MGENPSKFWSGIDIQVAGSSKVSSQDQVKEDITRMYHNQTGRNQDRWVAYTDRKLLEKSA